jgi:quinol monooxygenase YgiN
MVLARMTTWHFKEGKRESAFTVLDSFLNSSTRNANGFRGYMSMLSSSDPNVATTLTLWQDEEALEASEKGVFMEAIKRIQDSLQGTPSFENNRVFSTELFLKGT